MKIQSINNFERINISKKQSDKPSSEISTEPSLSMPETMQAFKAYAVASPNFKNLSMPIEVTDKYNKKVEGKDHLDLPNIHVYEYQDTNLQVLVNQMQNLPNKELFQASLSIHNKGIKNDSVVKKNLLMALMNNLLQQNNINADLNENFSSFINIDLTCKTDELNKISTLNKIITKPYFTQQGLETCKETLIKTLNSEKYEKESAEFKEIVDSSLLNSKEETIKNIQEVTLDDMYSYYSEILNNTEAQYSVTIDKSCLEENKKLFYSMLNSELSNKFQKHSDSVKSTLEPITNKQDVYFNDKDNETYLTFHYPIKIESDKERLIYRYLVLLEILWRAPYVSEDSNATKYSLPMELKNQNISPSNLGYLDFGFTPTGDEKIYSKKQSIDVFKAILEILYAEKLSSNTLDSIKDYEKELYDERLNKIYDLEHTHKILNTYKNNIFQIYETIDDIKIEDIREKIEQILFEQKPIIIVNEDKNPYKNNSKTNDSNFA